MAAAALTRGKSRRTPVVDIDGRRISDSTAIIAALEEHKPQPPLYPDEPGDRERALELEDFFDEELAPHTRRFFFFHTLKDSDVVARALATNGGTGQLRALRMSVPVMGRVMRSDFNMNAETARHSLEKIRAAMDRLEHELEGREYLVADRFSVADLAAATLFTPVLAPPGRQYLLAEAVPGVLEVREELSARPGGQWVNQTFARHRGTSHEVGKGGLGLARAR
jgi:glutathione S-transferase